MTIDRSEPVLCVVGGGSLAHALVAVLGGGAEVRVLTRQPARWSPTVRGLYLDVAEVVGRVALATDDPGAAVAGASIIFLCVPSCARAGILERIAPHLSPGAWVGCLPGFGGFEWQARRVLGRERTLFGLQRVPYVRRTISYGEAVWISGIRPRLYLGALPSARAPEVAARIEALLSIPTEPVANYLSVTLSNSNPLFHPARLYSVLRDWRPGRVLERTALFYHDWDDAATRVYVALDAEVLAVARALPGDLSHVRSIFEHYGVGNVASMTRTIRALRALRDRWLPLVDTGAGWVPDLRSSYVTEDLPYGLVIARAVGEIAGTPMPTTDRVLAWAERTTGRRWLDGGRVRGPDAAGLPIPQAFGITDAASLVAAGTE